MREPDGGRPAARGPTQLPLPLRLEDHAVFGTLVAGPNAAAVAHVRMLSTGRAGETLWLWGPRGVGKSHLLQAACREADAAGQRAMYVPLAAGLGLRPDVLSGLDALDFLALDGVDAVAGRADWERALFDVLNEFHSTGKRLLLAASNAPGAVGFALADLASRAAGATVYRLHPLGDDEQIDALYLHAQNRGFELEPAAARFLQARVERDMSALCGWLNRLDAASLAARRRITIPFIRDSLAAAAGPRGSA
ncbi:MAG TPA: DnaA regulatory inactivator Hda [Gammaproteobacteria bacterium]